MSDKFQIGDRVYKPEGYKFNGTVVSVFKTTKDATRLVVEMEGNGMLHIFNEKQLEKAVQKSVEEKLTEYGWTWQGHTYDNYETVIIIFSRPTQTKTAILEYHRKDNSIKGFSIEKQAYDKGAERKERFCLEKYDESLELIETLFQSTKW